MSDKAVYVRLPRTTGSPCPAGSTTMPLQAADGRLPQATPSRCPMRFGLLRIPVQIGPGHAGCALWRAGLLDVRQHAEEPSVGPMDHPEDWRVLLGQRSPTLCPIDHSRRRLRCRAGRRPGHDRRNLGPIRKSRRSCTRRSAGLTGRSNGGKKGLSVSLGRERAFSRSRRGPGRGNKPNGAAGNRRPADGPAPTGGPYPRCARSSRRRPKPAGYRRD
jgi:hypothetical protein